jgi:hypothetical protein
LHYFEIGVREMHSILVQQHHPRRQQVEAYIRSTYNKAYAAQILEFPAELIASISSSGKIICSAGIRTERSGFFSEIYLDKPVECLIAQSMGRPVARSEILEIGSLAFTSVRPCFDLLDEITLYGRQHGFKWCLFTGTEKLRRLLRLAGLQIVKLRPAEIEKITEPQHWGDYYATDPWVCLLKNIPCAPLELSHCKRPARRSYADQTTNLSVLQNA